MSLGSPSVGSDEEALVRAFQRGSVEACAELAHRHDAALVAFIAAVCGDAGRADDLAQEAWIRAIAKRDSLRDPSRFRPWLMRIAQRLFLMSARARANETLDPDVASADEATALDAVIAAEDAGRVRAALDALPEGRRAVVWLAVVEGCAHAEIGLILDIPEGTARTRLHYALIDLKSRLGGER